MMKLRAIEIKQGNTKFWISKVLLKDLMGKVRADHQSPDNPDGYQREISKSRARKFGKFMEKGGISPITILLNIRKPGAIKEGDGHIEIDEGVDWWIVDGQHRLEGLKIIAEEENPLVRDIQLPIILMNVPQIEEAKNFLIINKTQKGVRTDLAERIFSIMVEKEGKEKSIDLPIDLWKHEALQIVDLLTTLPESPLKGMIKRPGEKGAKPLKQVSVTDSLEPIVDNYKSFLPSLERLARALINMWSALKEICPECFIRPKDYLLLKTPGVFVVHKLFAHLLPTLSAAKDLTKGMFLKIFKHPKVSLYFESEYWDRNNVEGWSRFGTSQKSFKIITDLIWDEMSKVVEELVQPREDIRF